MLGFELTTLIRYKLLAGTLPIFATMEPEPEAATEPIIDGEEKLPLALESCAVKILLAGVLG